MIDWQRVTALKDEVGAEDFDEVVELFLAEVEEVTDRLARTVDATTLEHDMHFLKSSALTIGFSGFADQCQAAETCAASGQAAQVDVGAVLDSYRNEKAEFLTELPNRHAA